jgi:hypothetical protein
MSLTPGRAAGSSPPQRVVSGGESSAPPRILSFVWGALIVLLIIEAINETSGVGGPSVAYKDWLHDCILGAAAILILARALYRPADRVAWLAVGLGTVSWLIGTVGWSVAYGALANPPFPTFADIFWLLWYPLIGFGIFRLAQTRLQKISWHRWMDGVAVMLVVLAAGVAFVIEPTSDSSLRGQLAIIIEFSYPVLDVLMIGAIVGIFGLLGWRPDLMWILLGTGIVIMTVADSVYAVQEVGGVAGDSRYSFIWTTGAVLIAYAAWVRSPEVRNDAFEITGLRAVALPLVAQALAVAIQLFAFFHEIGRGERLVTVAVLIVSSIQIILTRPRPRAAESPVTPE